MGNDPSTLKHILRLQGQPSLWHLFVVLCPALAVGGFLGASAVHAFMGPLHLLVAAFLALVSLVTLVGVDFFVFRRAYLRFRSSENAGLRRTILWRQLRSLCYGLQPLGRSGTSSGVSSEPIRSKVELLSSDWSQVFQMSPSRSLCEFREFRSAYTYIGHERVYEILSTGASKRLLCFGTRDSSP